MIQRKPEKKAETPSDLGDSVSPRPGESHHASRKSPLRGCPPEASLNWSALGSVSAIADKQAENEERFTTDNDDGSNERHQEPQHQCEKKP